ncbi:unnamed protein product [Paramecium sonneborni]|uniref:Uncharacterized protein n=1 Tax=Paramecium sonneborni TaxID=65129 RepID=A0A8S1MZF7_9CILI|nr:unnamed protein product [Paramecium sonneborni]
MGVCSGKTSNKYQQNNRSSNLLQSQTVQLNQQKQNLIENQHAATLPPAATYPQQEPAKQINLQQNPVKPEERQQEMIVQNFDEDLYINDIMKQFDDLNNLFNQMASEFDSISQYLLSMSGNQGNPP